MDTEHLTQPTNPVVDDDVVDDDVVDDVVAVVYVVGGGDSY